MLSCGPALRCFSLLGHYVDSGTGRAGQHAITPKTPFSPTSATP